MRILGIISGLFKSTGDKDHGNDTPAGAIVDAESLASSAESARQPSAQEKISTLNRLAQFVEREKLPLTAVLYGSPLRAVADGELFRGVTVRYGADRSNAAQFVIGLLKPGRRRANTVVVTADRQTERAVLAAGGLVMHTATFRKALEPVAVARPRQNVRSEPAPSRPVDENRRIVNELIDPL